MARDLAGKRVAILATDGVERVELERGRPPRASPRSYGENSRDEAGSGIPGFPDEGGGEICGVADYSLVFSPIRDP
jgi:hypothetical protein